MPEPKSATRRACSAGTGALARACSNTSMNLLICFHLRDIDGINAPCASVTPRSRRKGRDNSR
ncbi:hypothetical protein D3C80_1657800 [compost metagenome]